MTQQTVLYVFQGLQLLGTLLPSTVEAALKIKAILGADGSDFNVQIATIQNGAVQDAQDTISMIDAWKREKGL